MPRPKTKDSRRLIDADVLLAQCLAHANGETDSAYRFVLSHVNNLLSERPGLCEFRNPDWEERAKER